MNKLFSVTVNLTRDNEIQIDIDYINPRLLSETISKDDYAYPEMLCAVIRECLIHANMMSDDIKRLLKVL